jgi:transposase
VNAVYLNVSKLKDGRTYLSIVKGYRDKDTGKTRKNVIKSLGYLDELEKKYDDPVAYFKIVATEMTKEEKQRRKVSISIDMDEELPEDAVGTKNLGYALPLKIYHKLGLDKFLNNKARSENFKFNTNSIMTLLTISRILSPGSKLKAYEEKERYFERFDFSLCDIYRALSHFDKISKGLQRYLYESVRTEYGSDTSVIYYDVTNYYFEIKRADELRKYGKAKQNRKKPITQMGLAMDADGIPIHYELFAGNKLDKETFRSVIGEIRKNYDTGRIVVVADMGIITGDNIYYLVGDKPEKPKNGYVFSFSVRGGAEAFQKYVLSAEGYTGMDGKPINEKTDFFVKSRVIGREINVTMDNGKTRKKVVYEKQVVFWNKKYYLKARAERAEVLAKAKALIADPKKFTKATSYGAAAYVNNLKYDKKTGEILDTGKLLSLDMAKIKEEEKYDGYYSIVTSELKMSAAEIIDTYRGLWEIEETFKITKDDLEARPVYVSDYAHINAHFLTCFIALTILRLIQKMTGKEYSAAKIIDCLNKIECMNEHENMYMFGYRSAISNALGAAFRIDFSKKRLRLADIKKIIGDVKK